MIGAVLAAATRENHALIYGDKNRSRIEVGQTGCPVGSQYSVNWSIRNRYEIFPALSMTIPNAPIKICGRQLCRHSRNLVESELLGMKRRFYRSGSPAYRQI